MDKISVSNIVTTSQPTPGIIYPLPNLPPRGKEQVADGKGS